MSFSTVDSVYRSVLLSKFFRNGWGDPAVMKRIFSFRKIISNRETCSQLVDKDYPIYVDREVESTSSYTLLDGHFRSPMAQYLPDILPQESLNANFQIILPKKWKHATLKPVSVHLAGTGDHFFWLRRTLMAKPLMKEGIASIILENPFYGVRKPPDQLRSSLKNVSDIFVMGGCLVLESLALFHWCERMGLGPLCITGISMGGHNASLAGTNWHKPISIVPCLSWTTASGVFTEGVMSGAIPWEVLENQYNSYDEDWKNEVKKMLCSPEDDQAFDAGVRFAKGFTNGWSNLINLEMFSAIKSRSSCDVKSKVDTFNFMRGIMDECTHLGNFSVPVDPELSIIVSATNDAYVPRDGLIPLTSLWRGSTQRFVNSGHITAVLFNLDVFRQAIKDSLNLNAKKYYNASLF